MWQFTLPFVPRIIVNDYVRHAAGRIILTKKRKHKHTLTTLRFFLLRSTHREWPLVASACDSRASQHSSRLLMAPMSWVNCRVTIIVCRHSGRRAIRISGQWNPPMLTVFAVCVWSRRSKLMRTGTQEKCHRAREARRVCSCRLPPFGWWSLGTKSKRARVHTMDNAKWWRCCSGGALQMHSELDY